MSEIVQRSTGIEYIHEVVANSPQKKKVESALNKAETLLRTVMTEPEKAELSPIVLETTVYSRITKPFPELNNDTPAAAILKTIQQETGTQLSGEIVIFRRRETKQHPYNPPTDVFVLKTDKLSKKSDKDELLRVDRLMQDGKIYASITALRRNGIEASYTHLKKLLADMPGILAQSRNGKPVMLYPEDDVYTIIAQQQTARKERKSTETKTLDLAVWATKKYYADVYNLSINAVTVILAQAGQTSFNHKTYYRRDNATEAFNTYYTTKKTTEGMYFRNGKPHVNLNYLRGRTGISYSALRKRLHSMALIDHDKNVTLYPLPDALSKLEELQGIPQVKKDGIYVDDNNRQWAGVTSLANLLGISIEKLRTFLVDEEIIPVRGMRNRTDFFSIYPAYNIDSITNKASSYLKRPTLNADTHIDAATLAQEYGVPDYSIKKHLQSIGQDARGLIRRLYPEKEARALLDTATRLPEIGQTDHYTADDGSRYITKHAASKSIGSYGLLNRAIETGTIKQITFRRGLTEITLFSVSDFETYKQKPRKPKRKQPKIVRDRSAEIEEKAKRFVDSGVELSKPSLQEKDASLLNLIYSTYPGGIRALRTKLGVDIRKPTKEKPVRKSMNWAGISEDERNDLLEQKARTLLSDGSRLTAPEIQKMDGSLLAAIRRYYSRGSGGLGGLRENVGVADAVRKSHNWKKDKNPVQTIRDKVEQIMRDNGGNFISTDLLKAGLWEPVRTYWPGGYAGLRKDMKLPVIKTPSGHWTPDTIQKEVKDIIKLRGSFSTSIAQELGKDKLLAGIRDHYTGGITQLMKDLNITPNRRTWDKKSIEQEAAKLMQSNDGKLSYAILKQVKGLHMAVVRHYPGGIHALKQQLTT